MSSQLEILFEIPSTAKAGICAGLVAMILAIFYFLIYADLGTDIEKIRDSVEGAKGLEFQIAQQKGIVKNLPKYEQEVAALKIELDRALKELPDKKETHLLLARVSEKAKDSGLSVQMFKPQAEQKKDFYAEVPVEIQIAGTFHEVATFFDEVGNLERIVNVDRINMIEPQQNDDKTVLKTSLIATTFRFLDESERPTADVQKEGKKRRKPGAGADDL